MPIDLRPSTLATWPHLPGCPTAGASDARLDYIAQLSPQRAKSYDNTYDKFVNMIRESQLAMARAYRDTLAIQLQVALNRVKEAEAMTGLLRLEADVARVRAQEAGEDIVCLQEIQRREGHPTFSQPAPVGSMPPPPPPLQATNLATQPLEPAPVPGNEIAPNDSLSQVGDDGSSSSNEDENSEGKNENENEDGLSYVSTAHTPIADPALKQLNEEKLPEPQNGSE